MRLLSLAYLYLFGFVAFGLIDFKDVIRLEGWFDYFNLRFDMGIDMNMGLAVVAPFLCVAAALRTLPVLRVGNTLGLWDKVGMDLAVVAALKMAAAALLSTLGHRTTLDLCLAGVLDHMETAILKTLLSTASTLETTPLVALALGSSHAEMDSAELVTLLGIADALMTLSALGDTGALRISRGRVAGDFMGDAGRWYSYTP